MHRSPVLAAVALLAGLLPAPAVVASGGAFGPPRNIEYAHTPPAPARQTAADAHAKSAGCETCHTKTDSYTMHVNPGVVLGCTDCHGGNAHVTRPRGTKEGDPAYRAALDEAHVQPLYPDAWHYPDSATPHRTYTLLNYESPEFVRFINPGDYRVADQACGACHEKEIKAAKLSLMATSTMLWGGASYNNGLLPFKRYMLGETYVTLKGKQREEAEHHGLPVTIGAITKNPVKPTPAMEAKGVLPFVAALPTWEVVPPADIFRVFERGGRVIGNLFPDTGLPDASGSLQKLEEPGRPDIRQSNRARGTGGRIAVPVINLYKTRLNDPFTWFFGTDDQPGDYRSSGCSACHVVYSNDRDPAHSGPYAKYGHGGTSASVDPTIPKNESGHPLEHQFTRAIPSSTCMTCHMHQPNVFLNSYYGYTMWDYESDAPRMWPKKQRYVSKWDVRPGTKVDPSQILGDERAYQITMRNPEEAALHGLWSDPKFLGSVWDRNKEMKDTQFADYHGHGWNFRAIFKRDRHGNLLDAKGNIVSDNDPDKFRKAVHMSSGHMDAGMHCVDCHFTQDSHGNGHLIGEVAQAIEIDCIDCHGTVDQYPNLHTTGPAAPPGGTDLSLLRTQDGRARFEWRDGKLYQRSALWPNKEWRVPLVKDIVNPASPDYDPKAARAKLMSDTGSMEWGLGVPAKHRAHKNEDMTCFTCHSSWATSCGGCHLPIQANWKTRRHHYDADETRNYATYNPQVARDQMFQLGKHGPAKGGRITPVRSSSALVLSSRNSNRELIYIQQPPISAAGFSSQAFAPHFPHTVRTVETKTCTDCHISKKNDNNAIMAQLLLLGTNFVNFVGYNAWLGTEDTVEAVTVTEWDEPQAVIGSYLHKYAYPDWYKQHLEHGRRLQQAHDHASKGRVGCLQLRGEYLYVAQGKGGFEAYDVANIANKGVSERIISAPFSPLGHNTRVPTKDATCMALATTQPVDPDRRHRPGFGLTAKQMTHLMDVTNEEQELHPIYKYALITDAKEGLILVDISTLIDGDAQNNFLTRALTWNGNHILDGARHITVGGTYVYIAADAGLVILDMDHPLHPKVAAVLKLDDVRASALQFRYLFVTDKHGLQVVDVTDPHRPHLVPGATVPLRDAHRVYVARTYAYVAAGPQGLAIVDVEQPEHPKLYMDYTADGKMHDARDVIVGTTNASLFAYVADGAAGLKVLQLTSPKIQPKFYGFSPAPKPHLIATYKTPAPALSISKGLARDRAVDETGHQIAIFGRIGSRPFNLKEMHKLYLKNDKPWYVTDDVQMSKFRPGPSKTAAAN